MIHQSVRLVHLVAAVMWPAAAAFGSWRARRLQRRRLRVRVHLLMTLGLVVGANSLVMAFSPIHPDTVLHVVTVATLAIVGILALYLIAAYGDDLVHEERVLFALSRGHLGPDDGPAKPSQPLSRRELEILGVLCQGLRTDEIAAKLGISKHTVVTHVRNIMRKLEVSSRVDAVSWAIRSGVLDPASRTPTG